MKSRITISVSKFRKKIRPNEIENRTSTILPEQKRLTNLFRRKLLHLYIISTTSHLILEQSRIKPFFRRSNQFERTEGKSELAHRATISTTVKMRPLSGEIFFWINTNVSDSISSLHSSKAGFNVRNRQLNEARHVRSENDPPEAEFIHIMSLSDGLGNKKVTPFLLFYCGFRVRCVC